MKQPNTFPSHAVAIVGLSGRFPDTRSGSHALDDFWRNILEGRESLESLSGADLDAASVDPRLSASRNYVRKATVLGDADKFDAAFFGIAPREAQLLDPQQRIFLECAWEALEHAGYAANATHLSVGVYGGVSMNTYLLHQLLSDPELVASAGSYQLMLGNDKDFLCTRVSYKLDLRGPSVTVQTACSTSLVAVVMACRALARGECDLALAGGVSVSFPQRMGYLYQEGMILSPDGHCRPFDAKAGGTRAGAGCGIVVLKRLDDALADRDTIHAVIRGGALNNDGAAKAGYTAPSVDGQVEVIATAQALAGVEPRDIGYIEAHGTATPLGDPIEVAALTQAFRASTPDTGFCRLGSLKANLGHLDVAAGVAGLIKTVLVLKNARLPPLVNFTSANPQLELETSPFVASGVAGEWESGAAPRRAGVSSFGIGGTNAHVVLEEAPPVAAREPVRDPHLLVLSARTASGLESLTKDLAQHIEQNPDVRMDDIEWTLQLGRRSFGHRLSVLVRDRAHALEALAHPERPPVLTATHEGGTRSVAFLFSGQGSQFAGMAAQLYQREPVFRACVDRCAVLLEPRVGMDIRSLLTVASSGAAINETRLAQPCLFVMEYALASLWQSWGVQPAAMLGHSIGEYVAAHLAGVMSLEDALAVVAARGSLMQALPPGTMAAVHLPEAELRARLIPGVEIAAINAPALCSISGTSQDVAKLLQQLRASGVDARELHTSHAFHSSMMEPALAPFIRMLETIRLAEPSIPYVSNLTGTWITKEEATSPAYYAEHLRKAVRFEAGVRTLAADPALWMIEVGPGNVLTTLARQTLGKEGPKRVMQSTARVSEQRDDVATMRDTAGRLWLGGVSLDFAGLHAGATPRRVPLPTYPFERKRFWIERTADDSAPRPEPHATGLSNRLEDWTYAPTWVRDDVNPRREGRLSGTWIVFGDKGALSAEVLASLQSAGAETVLVERGSAYSEAGASRFVARAGAAEDVSAVLEALKRNSAGSALRVAGAINLWAVDPQGLSPRAVYDSLVAVGVGLGSAGIAARVIHAATGLESVLQDAGRRSDSALAIGPVLVLPTEYPQLTMRSVDIGSADDARSVATILRTEAVIEEWAPQVAWRGGRRWIKRWERASLPAATESTLPLKRGGVYLITGALGGLGLTFAQWLGTDFKARLLLTARTPLPPRTSWDEWIASHPATERHVVAIHAIRAIEAAGGEVLVMSADAADEQAMRAAIDAASTRWGRIDGVIHAAGIAGSGMVAALKSGDDVAATLGPKVSGLHVLEKLLGDRPLDFVALMSSINAILGAPGTCDYAAANAVLDAFAESDARPAQWRTVVSFNWGAWRDVGMAANLVLRGAQQQAQWDEFLSHAIPPAKGVEAFARGLASGRTRVGVVAHDFLGELGRRAAAPAAVETPAAQSGAAAPPPDAGAAVSRPELSTAFEAPGSDTERKLAAIWEQLLGIQGIGRHDDFFELGGHSLLATRVLAHVQESLGARLTLREVFDSPTVNKMAMRIEAAAGSAAARGAQEEEREELEF